MVLFVFEGEFVLSCGGKCLGFYCESFGVGGFVVFVRDLCGYDCFVIWDFVVFELYVEDLEELFEDCFLILFVVICELACENVEFWCCFLLSVGFFICSSVGD